MKLLCLLTLLTVCLPTFAQKEEGPVRRCRVIFIERPRDAPDKAYLFDGIKSHAISLSSMNLSETITLSPGSTTIGISAEVVQDPELFPPTAPSAKIPTNTKEFYLILLSDPNNKHFPVKCMAMGSGGEMVNLGETLWVNLSRNVISGKIANKEITVNPGKSLVGKAPLNKPGYYKVEFDYQQLGKKEFQPIMRKTWWFDPQSKYLGFILNKGDRLPKIYTFRDRPPLKPIKEEKNE